LALANNPEVKRAAMSALEEHGFGVASVRFLSGTHELHKKLEAEMRDFLNVEDCILFGSCYDANSGAFEALVDDKGLILSDELNHASIIDGVRLSRATRQRYRHRDLND